MPGLLDPVVPERMHAQGWRARAGRNAMQGSLSGMYAPLRSGSGIDRLAGHVHDVQRAQGLACIACIALWHVRS